MFSKNLEVSWRCLKQLKLRAAITHFLNAFLSTKKIWIIHPEPSPSEQKRIFRAYKSASKFKQIVIIFFTKLIWIKSPEKLTKERIKYFKNKSKN